MSDHATPCPAGRSPEPTANRSSVKQHVILPVTTHADLLEPARKKTVPQGGTEGGLVGNAFALRTVTGPWYIILGWLQSRSPRWRIKLSSSLVKVSFVRSNPPECILVV